MHRVKYLVLVISLLSIIHAVVSDGQADTTKSNLLTCNVTNATEEVTGCPPSARCIDNGASQGVCHCPNSTFNKNYTASNKDSKYCIDETPHTKEELKITTTLSPTKATEVSTASTSTTSTLKPEITTPKKVEPTTTQKPAIITTTTTTTTAKPDDVKVVPAAEPHHILGGILLPMLIVLGFIGAVFAVKKYDLLERAHGFIRNRNQRERYSGLNENDFDDDPLLI